MGITSDQIEAEIADTRERMSARLDTVTTVSASNANGAQESSSLTNITSTITEQIRRRPLTALGLSIVAGSLLQNVVQGVRSQSGTGSTTTASLAGGGQSASSGVTDKLSSAGDTIGQAAGYAGDTATGAASTASDTEGSAVSGATDTVTGATQTAVGATTDAARSVAGATSDVASSVVDTTTDVAGSVASTTAGATSKVADTATDLASQTTDQLSSAVSTATGAVQNLGGTVNQQIQQRPLTALGLSIGVGMAAQPLVGPQVSKVTQGVRGQASKLTSSLSSTITPPNPEDVEQIRVALVPATVDRARQFARRDLRELLERNLENLVSQTSLRAGMVAAVTERAEDLVDNRLPQFLNTALSGNRGLVVGVITAKVLKARDSATQGLAPSMGSVKVDFPQKLVSTTKDDLQRYFPEFRQHIQATENPTQQSG